VQILAQVQRLVRTDGSMPPAATEGGTMTTKAFLESLLMMPYSRSTSIIKEVSGSWCCAML
jgi:hypothetical protein